MFWFNKHDPNVLYVDNRTHAPELLSNRQTFEVAPDQIEDFTHLSFANESFSLVVFDPPHLTSLLPTAYLAKKYGRLLPNWEDSIAAGFEECFRVLKPYGTLVFKWNEHDVPLKDVLRLTPVQPLFGNRSGKKGMTHWLVFTKRP